MRKEERGEERDTTTHLIKIQIFTHVRHVVNFVPTDSSLQLFEIPEPLGLVRSFYWQ